MGMFTHVRGYKSSEEHEKHMRVLKFCREERVTLPRETAAYLGNDSEGISADSWTDDELDEKLEIDIETCVSQPSREYEDCWEISVKDIPPEVIRIRFTNFY